MKTRTIALASAVALSAATATAVPAYAAPAAPGTGVVQYADTADTGSASGSLENPVIASGLVILAGVGVSLALAVGAGVAGGAFELPAFELPQIPGLPF